MFHNQYVQLIPFRAFQIPLCVQSRALGFFSFMRSWRRLSFKSLRNPSFESSPQTLFTLQWSSSDDSKDIVDFVSIQKSDLSPPSPISTQYREALQTLSIPRTCLTSVLRTLPIPPSWTRLPPFSCLYPPDLSVTLQPPPPSPQSPPPSPQPPSTFQSRNSSNHLFPPGQC